MKEVMQKVYCQRSDSVRTYTETRQIRDIAVSQISICRSKPSGMG